VCLVFCEVRCEKQKIQAETDSIMRLVIYSEPHVTHLEYIDTPWEYSPTSGMSKLLLAQESINGLTRRKPSPNAILFTENPL
jgi:hypothetical protein